MRRPCVACGISTRFAWPRARFCRICLADRLRARNALPVAVARRKVARAEQDYTILARALDAHFLAHDVTTYHHT